MKNIMNFAKLFSVMLVSMAVMNTASFAQSAGNGKGGSTTGTTSTTKENTRPKAASKDSNIVDVVTYRLKSRLSLSDAQVDKVKAILTSMKEQAKKDRQAYKEDKEGMKKAGKDRWTKAENEIKALLDANQAAKFDTGGRSMLKEEWVNYRKSHKGNGKGKAKGHHKDHEKHKKGHEKNDKQEKNR